MKRVAPLLLVLCLSGCADILGGNADAMTPDEMGAAVADCKRHGLEAVESLGMKKYAVVVVGIRCQIPRASR